MNLTITNTDEVTVYLLFASTAIFVLSAAMLIYCCGILIDTRQKLKAFRFPERERNGDWPHIERHERK